MASTIPMAVTKQDESDKLNVFQFAVLSHLVGLICLGMLFADCPFFASMMS